MDDAQLLVQCDFEVFGHVQGNWETSIEKNSKKCIKNKSIKFQIKCLD